MDSITIGVIRKKIFEYYETEKEVPTLDEIVDMLQETNLNCEHERLKRLLHDVGYRYVRCNSPSRRHILIEKTKLVCKRIDYLKKMKEFRAEKRHIYFMHETYMERREVSRKGHRCLRIEVPAKIDKKERLVILHAGGPNGLLKGSFTTIKSDSETGDHFGDVNLPRFEKWVNETLKDKLQPNSVIVISSAAHCSIQKDKKPFDLFTLKSDMEEWLTRHNISFGEDLLKIDLLQLIKKTPTTPVYVIDEILKGLGHTVVRVPKVHPELNPLSYVWADIKKKIANHHNEAPLEEKRKIWDKMYTECSSAAWQRWDDVVRNTENEYSYILDQFDDIIDDIIERYEKDLNSDSDDWDSDKSDETDTESE